MLNASKSWNDYKMKHKECQKVYNMAKIMEPIITKDIIDICKKNHTITIGLEYAVKEASHVDEKLKMAEKEHGIKPIDKIKTIGDLVRYTQLCSHDNIADVTQNTIKQLKDKGYTITEVDNKFASPHKKTGYRGMHINAISPMGQKFELQIHSAESLDAKNRGHEIYKKIQSSDIDEEEKNVLKKQVKEIHSFFPQPNDIDIVKSFKSQIETEIKDYDIEIKGENDGSFLFGIIHEKVNDKWKRKYFYEEAHNDNCFNIYFEDFYDNKAYETSSIDFFLNEKMPVKITEIFAYEDLEIDEEKQDVEL